MKIIPVINCDSVSCAREKLELIKTFSPRVTRVHIDTGARPVSSISIPLFSKLLAPYSKKFLFELHGMVPERMFFLPAHRARGIKRVYYHLHEIHDREKFEQKVQEWKKFAVEVGIVITTQSPKKTFILPRGVRRVLVLAVKPGKANQKFNSRTYGIISALKEQYPRVILTVDGGITPAIARKLKMLGVSAVTSSGYIWNNKNSSRAYRELLQPKVKNQKPKVKNIS